MQPVPGTITDPAVDHRLGVSRTSPQPAADTSAPSTYVLEGLLDKDEPLHWTRHYKLGSHWISHWLQDTLPRLTAGACVRITIEQNHRRKSG